MQKFVTFHAKIAESILVNFGNETDFPSISSPEVGSDITCRDRMSFL